MPEKEAITRQLSAGEFESLVESCGLKFGDFVQSTAFSGRQGRIIGAKLVNGVLSVILDNGGEYYPDVVELIDSPKS